jgi:acylaminoacyl-peptidase
MRIATLTALFTLYSLYSFSQEKTPMELNDVFDLEYVSEPQVSPDGKRVVYVRNFKDIMTDQNLSNLWMINSDGTKNRPLTSGNQKERAPQWSNDGSRIIYNSNKNGKSELYLTWVDEGITMKLSNTTSNPRSVAWSPDDEMIAFNMFVPAKSKNFIQMPPKPEGAKWNQPPTFINDLNYRRDGQGYLKDGYNQIFVLSTNGGTPKQLTNSSFNHGSPVWSKDGKYLFFSANLREEGEYDPRNTEIYRLQLSNGEINALTTRQGPDNGPAVSPDGSKIAYTGFDDAYLGYQQNKLYIMNADGSGVSEVLSDFDRSVENIQWGGDGKTIYFQYDDLGNTRLAYTSLSGKITEITTGVGGLSIGRPYTSGDYSVSKENSIAFTLGNSDHPADLGVYSKGKISRLTTLNQDLFSFRKLGEVEEFWFESSHDQRKIQGWIVKPPDFDPDKKYPLILEIHGGPFAAYSSFFAAEIQLYAAAGYVVLYTNPRGSSSYGKEFGNLIHHNYPSQDYDDLMSGVDAVIEKGYVDKDQLFVTGGSGGGVLTAWIVGNTDRFKAAVVAKPVINWYSFVLYADGPAFFSKYWFEKFPWEDPQPYLDRSPLSLVGNVTTPTMLLTGEEDYRTPIAESEQYYAALKLRKVESALVRIPGASHGIAARPSNLIGKVAAILSWFNNYREE